MNDAPLYRRLCLTSRGDGIRGLLAAVLLTMGGSSCWAAMPAGAPPEDRTATVGLNQSVSVDAVGRPRSTESGEVAPAGSSTVDPVSQGATGAVRTFSSDDARPRTLRRALRSHRQQPGDARAEGTDRAVKHSVTPWYKTGLGSLGVVLAVVGVSVWAVRRWIPAARSGGGSAMRVAGRVNLTPKHSIALVHVGRRYLLVGLSGDRMTTLSEVSDPDEVAALAARVNTQSTHPPAGFDELLMHEATDFRSTSVPEQTDTSQVKTASGGGRRMTGLQDLVDRLKSLQTK